MNTHAGIFFEKCHIQQKQLCVYLAIVIPIAPELTHRGRDGSCYANLDVSTLNETTL